MPTIIGLSGKIGSGKDTAAEFLVERYPMLKRSSFALKVKQIVGILTNTSTELNLTREGKSSTPPGFDMTLGKMQQLVGQGMRDLICDDIWIISVLNNVKGFIVISDVRYPNEVEAIKARGGVVYRINRTTDLEDDGREAGHSSETALDDYDGFTDVIENDGSLEEFMDKLVELTKEFKLPTRV